jgi:hypothetical protein
LQSSSTFDSDGYWGDYPLTDKNFHLFCYRKNEEIILLGGNAKRGAVSCTSVSFDECIVIANEAHQYVVGLQ